MFQEKKGFTLIETLIYIGIIGIIVTALTSFTISIGNSRNKTYVVQEVHANARFALNLIGGKIREADIITSPASGNSTGTIVLKMQGANPDITFNVNDGILQMIEGADSPISMTAGRVNIDSITFTNLGRVGERENIHIKMTISYRNNESTIFNYSNTYQTSISIRK